MRKTLQDAYNTIVSTHEMYTNHKNRWNFLLESYIGGDEYRKAGHLTRYSMETNEGYSARLTATPLDNHCRSVIATYTSFLFRNEPYREFASLENNLNLEAFLKDADLDGRSLNAFMKDVAIWSSVFGHCWIIVAKPNVNAGTRAEELGQGIRPYLNLLTPLTVTDWEWKREASGAYTLSYLKYVEDVNDTRSVIKEWTLKEIKTSTINHESRELEEEYTEPNGLGEIPAVIAYSSRSPVRGFGASQIGDIADHQKKIYNEYSEIEQSIRLNGHPTLVKTAEVEASAGAGSIALMPDNMDPGLKPYHLSVSTDIGQIYQSIESSVNAIDKMANTGAVRATEARTMSGVAMETEFQLLNAKLAEIADHLELAEEQMWRIWCLYEGTAWDGEVDYPGSFNIKDTSNDLEQLKLAVETATDPMVQQYANKEILEIFDVDVDELEEEYQAHVMIDPVTGTEIMVTTLEQHEKLMALGWQHNE